MKDEYVCGEVDEGRGSADGGDRILEEGSDALEDIVEK